MKMSQLLLAGAGFGIAAWAFRNRRDCRLRIGERHFDNRDATLLGKKDYLTDVGGQSSAHIRQGIGRTTNRTPA